MTFRLAAMLGMAHSAFARLLTDEATVERETAAARHAATPRTGRRMYARGGYGRSPRGKRKEAIRLAFLERVRAA